MLRLSDIDTNLLVVFDLIHRKRNLNRVAERLGITQPAVSHALKRLRTLLDDELFERTSSGLAPTPYANRLHPLVEDALSQLERGLNLARGFHPAASDRRFTVSMTDIGEIASLEASGITSGCSTTSFCPDRSVTRAEMAAFLVRALNLPTSMGNPFDDDDGHILEREIASLAASGITSGCSATSFCPNRAVTRAEMAAFLIRALA